MKMLLIIWALWSIYQRVFKSKVHKMTQMKWQSIFQVWFGFWEILAWNFKMKREMTSLSSNTLKALWLNRREAPISLRRRIESGDLSNTFSKIENVALLCDLLKKSIKFKIYKTFLMNNFDINLLKEFTI